MANAKVRGITIELGADTSGISKALGGLNSEINNTQKQLKDVERLLKLDPTNTQLLEQKQRLLADAVGSTSKKLDALKEAQTKAAEEVKKGTKGSQESYDALTREIVATEDALKNLQKEQKKVSEAMMDIKQVADKVAESSKKIAEKTKGLSTAAAGLSAALLGNAYAAALAADDINTMSKQTGISTDMIQKMKYASDMIDVSLEDMTGSMSKLTKQMASGSDAFETLGVSIYNTDGTLRGAEEVWWETLDALSQIPNETERDAMAMEIFGKSAASLTGVIDDGGAALKELGQQAEDAGLILSGDALNDANAFNDAIDELKATASSAFMEAGASLATTLVPALETLVQKVSEVLIWFGNLDGTTQVVILTVLGLVAAIGPVAGLITTVAGAVSALTPILAAVGAAFTAAGGMAGIFGSVMAFITSPIGIAVAAIAGLIAIGVLLYKNWETICEKAKEIWGAIKTAVSNAINAIKLPHFSITGQFSILPPSVPKLKIDWYADGGILSGAQIFGAMGGRLMGGGEAGKEAVLPLNSFYSHLADIMENTNSNGDTFNINVSASFADAGERNLDELADEIAERISFSITQKERAFR